MRRHHQVFLALLIAVLAGLLPTAVALGQARPPVPHLFFGTVNINGGQPAPVGMVVTAVVDKDLTSEKRYPITITEAGKFGGPDFYDEKLKVGGDSQGIIAPNSQIEFFVTVERLGEPEDIGPPFALVNFASGVTQELVPDDLSGPTVPNPTLTVTKVVVNNDGGTAVAGAFTITVSGNGPSPASFAGSASGTVVTLGTGAYSVSESGPGGYTASQTTDCAGTLALGEVKTCTFTNDDIASTTGSGPGPGPGPDGDDDDSAPPSTGGGGGGGGGGGASLPSTPRPARPASTAVPPTATLVPAPTVGVVPPQLPTAAPLAVAPSQPQPTATVAPTPTPVPPVDTTTGGGGEDGGFPWWGWALIVLGVASVIGGGAFYYLRVQNA